MAAPTDPVLVFSAMRDEGAHLVEWVTWYRMLGCEILVAVNDCTDRSEALLAAFARAGWLEWFAHDPPDGVPPKQAAHAQARRHAATRRAGWLLICDADEFLVPHRGGGGIDAYLDAVGRGHDGIALHWRCFGTGGEAHYAPGLTHRRFTRCGPARRPPNIWLKTLVRDPHRFERWGDHMPWAFEGRGTPRFVDSEGRPLAAEGAGRVAVRHTAPEAIAHGGAQMNHYALRSREEFELKRGTPSATAFRDRYTDDFFERFNRNVQRDLSALAFAAPFDRLHAEAMALPGVARHHHLCCADRVARICRLQGRAPKGDPRWREAMMRAAI
ncbi:glycosyltransferase family 2 protein [Limimaricola pyoseonensis]|uniref:Glycosyl transferase family 2 n=1 Tax=Limimaricola pyoseonensis TaxID=521013 RepID=A0A1G7LDA4_9RHOB|nr:glycosyltransferase family 2 protein [Limimaricola pyoseonensis]SDF47284.1 Glycosyl transferase family 2 [Limimaricola pyoseonensis]